VQALHVEGESESRNRYSDGVVEFYVVLGIVVALVGTFNALANVFAARSGRFRFGI
jgi:hypothetical protein